MAVNELKFVCVAQGTTHQGNRQRFFGKGSQCVAMAAVGSIYSYVIKRDVFEKSEINIILKSGDDLYMSIRPPCQVFNHPELEPEELPSEIRIHNYLVKIGVFYIPDAQSTFASCISDLKAKLSELKHILKEKVFDKEHNDHTDRYLFTGQGYTVSFWRSNDSFFVYNSHAVGPGNKYDTHSGRRNVSRQFQCLAIKPLAQLLFARSVYDGNEYCIHRLRIKSCKQLKQVPGFNLKPVVLLKRIPDTVLSQYLSNMRNGNKNTTEKGKNNNNNKNKINSLIPKVVITCIPAKYINKNQTKKRNKEQRD